MSDAPLHGAQASDASGIPHKTDPRDVADIDRELEAYLAEKRSSQSVNLDYSVDSQLSRIKEKVSDRTRQAIPQKKDFTPQPESNLPPIKPSAVVDSAKDTRAVQNSAPSHEDLIRSLEEKYSQGKEAGPQNKKEALPLGEAKVPEKKEEKIPTEPVPEKTAPATEENATNQPVPKKVETPRVVESKKPPVDIFLELKENIDRENKSEVLALLEAATKLSVDDQKTLAETFLPRFRRNKERKELFLRTQTELSEELRAFTDKRLAPSSQKSEEQSPTPASATAPKQFDVLDAQKRTRDNAAPLEREREPLPVHDPFSQYVKEENKTAPQEVPERKLSDKARVPDYNPKAAEQVSGEPLPQEKDQRPAPSAPETAVQEEPLVEEKDDPAETAIERYKQFLINSDRKPTVLVYDPEQGFVRKAIDPNDTSLNLNFSFDESTDTVTLQVLDKDGILLSEIRTPQSEF